MTLHMLFSQFTCVYFQYDADAWFKYGAFMHNFHRFYLTITATHFIMEYVLDIQIPRRICFGTQSD